MTTALAVILTLLGAAARLVPHPANFVPLGALALYAGARLPRRWAPVVPLAAMVLSDVVIDGGRISLGVVRLTSYATFAAIVVLGARRKDAGPAARVGMSLGASTLFYLTTNLAVWAAPGFGGLGVGYPLSPAGLLACYVAALPFFGNALAADLLGTGALFGLDALARRLARVPGPIAADLG